MKSVLLPTDFSENAGRALEFAVEMALRLDSRLIIFHSFHSFYAGPHVIPVSEKELRAEDLEKLLSVKALAENLAAGRELEIVVESRPGLAADAIVAYADELNAELIVMGTQGATGMDEVLLGSVTSHVIERANVPVLAVPKKVTWSNLEKIALGLDFSDENRLINAQLIKFAKLFDAHITCVHVYGPDENVQLPTSADLVKSYPSLMSYPKISYKAEVADTVEKGLDHFILTERPDLLAVYTHHRGFFGRIFNPSITKKLACHTDIPLLAFHA